MDVRTTFIQSFQFHEKAEQRSIDSLSYFNWRGSGAGTS
jgi:hypothetical protein